MTFKRWAARCCTTWALLALAVAAAAQSTDSGRTLEGAWNVTLEFAQPGLPPCAPAGTVFTTTHPGKGTVIAESCYASESTGYGSWVAISHSQFAVTFVGNSFASDGTVASTYKVRARVALDPGGHEFTGPFEAEFFDLGGTSLGAVTGSVNADRILAEP